MDGNSDLAATIHMHDGRPYRVEVVDDSTWAVFRDVVFVGQVLGVPRHIGGHVRDEFTIRLACETESETGHVDGFRLALDHLIELAAWRYDEAESERPAVL